MKTPTHALVGWGFASLLGATRQERRAAALGAVLPDLPVWGLFLGCMILHRGTGVEMRVLMDRVYFADPVFQAAHHLGHAPLPLLALTLLVMALQRPLGPAAGPLIFGLIGAASHMVVDLFTHGRDGAMVLWPLDRERRLDMNLDQWDLGGPGLLILTLEMVIWLGDTLALALRRRNGHFPAYSKRFANTR